MFFPLFYKIYIYFLFSTPFLYIYDFFFCSLYFTCKPTQHISVFIFMFGSINRYDLLLIHPFKDLAFILFPIFYKQLTILLYIKKKLYILWFSLIIKDFTHITIYNISINVRVNLKKKSQSNHFLLKPSVSCLDFLFHICKHANMYLIVRDCQLLI